MTNRKKKFFHTLLINLFCNSWRRRKVHICPSGLKVLVHWKVQKECIFVCFALILHVYLSPFYISNILRLNLESTLNSEKNIDFYAIFTQNWKYFDKVPCEMSYSLIETFYLAFKHVSSGVSFTRQYNKLHQLERLVQGCQYYCLPTQLGEAHLVLPILQFTHPICYKFCNIGLPWVTYLYSGGNQLMFLFFIVIF